MDSAAERSDVVESAFRVAVNRGERGAIELATVLQRTFDSREQERE